MVKVRKLQAKWIAASAWAMLLSMLAMVYEASTPLPGVLRAKLRAERSGVKYAEALTRYRISQGAVVDIERARLKRLREREDQVSGDLVLVEDAIAARIPKPRRA